MCIRDRYNTIVHEYNSSENRIAEVYMNKMNEYAIYNIFFNPMRTFPARFLMFFACLFVPLLPFILVPALLIVLIQYELSYRVFCENEHKVPDPFQNMIFSPDLCRITNNNHRYYELSIKDLEGLSFNFEVIRSLRMREIQGKIRFMVYNAEFSEYYTNFPTHRRSHITNLIFAIVLSVINCFVYYKIFHDNYVIF
eukprot:TRINITY_DN5358_c0_g1_i1.p1 TRINITY_DN5358_c0_g1~~TRINITY_DN5358_c0_g1_i1.p1  ORF type:complete len:219 (+),score=46.63 TRINITY_DN5358_c0_g1_i1:70-657(+)